MVLSSLGLGFHRKVLVMISFLVSMKKSWLHQG